MGREFDHLFDEWASHYDDTVTGTDEQYIEVFLDYERILRAVASRVKGFILEFGVGTGNLTSLLLAKGNLVTGIEPSQQMRKKAKEKLPFLTLINGDFLHFPVPKERIDGLVSTYAFHHLTDSEKEQAIALYSSLLPACGKIVFADTMFPTLQDKKKILHDAIDKGYDRLADDLQTEYYSTIPYLHSILDKHGFDVTFKQYNRFVWVMEAVKR